MGMDNWTIIGYIAGIFLCFAFELILVYFEPIKEEDYDDEDWFLDVILAIVWPIAIIILIIDVPILLFEYVNCQGLKRQRQRGILKKINHKEK